MRELITDLFDRLAKHAAFFYISMLVVLIGVQADFFNNKYLSDNIIEIMIVLNAIPLASFFVSKISKRKEAKEPSTICPVCNEKMITQGSWKCTGCDGTFKHGKKGNLKSGT